MTENKNYDKMYYILYVNNSLTSYRVLLADLYASKSQHVAPDQRRYDKDDLKDKFSVLGWSILEFFAVLQELCLPPFNNILTRYKDALY